MNTMKKCLGLRSPADWVIWTSSVTPRGSLSCARNSTKFRDMQICLCGIITQLWHHGHLVFMVSCICDHTLYLTPEEYPQRTGKWVGTSNHLKPEIAIAGRCKSSDVEYAVANSMWKHDMAQHCRHLWLDRKAGEYIFFCSVCGVHAVMCDELDHALRCKHISLQDKQ